MEVSDKVSVMAVQDVMRDPVVCSDGSSYERTAIVEWLKTHTARC